MTWAWAWAMVFSRAWIVAEGLGLDLSELGLGSKGLGSDLNVMD